MLNSKFSWNFQFPLLFWQGLFGIHHPSDKVEFEKKNVGVENSPYLGGGKNEVFDGGTFCKLQVGYKFLFKEGNGEINSPLQLTQNISPTKNPTLIIQSLNFGYPNSQKNIFQNFNLELNPGIYRLIGRNGKGKTTLLNLIHQSYFGNFSSLLKKSRQTRNSFAFPQISSFYFSQQNVSLNLLPWYSSQTNFILRARWAKQQPEAFFETTKTYNLDVLGIDWKQKVGSLSGGQKQIVAFIKAICVDSDLLILDEPFNNIDQKNLEFLKQIILQFYAKNPNKIIIYTDHTTSSQVISNFEQSIYLE